jgi:predicted Zn-dependent peptidase
MSIESALQPSGLRVVTERMPDVGSVAIGFWVGVGSRDEATADAGASHFLEHLLFKGTPTRSAVEIAELIDAVGGEMNAFTAHDHTAFYLRVLAQDLGLALDVLSDIIWTPAFRPDEVEAERHVILEELLMRGDDPEDLAQELLAEALYPGHPLGRDVLGTERSVRAMPLEAIQSFHDRHYRPGALVFAAAGAVDHDQVRAEAERRWGASGRPSGGSLVARTAPAPPRGGVHLVRRRTEQAHIAIGIPTVDRHHPDRYAVTIVTHILGGGVSSRLFQEIRERRGLAYSVYAYRNAYDDAGSVVIYAGTSPAHTSQVLSLVGSELDALAADVGERELRVARGNLCGSLALGLEDSGARMTRIARGQLLHGEALPIQEVLARYEAVTLDDLRRVAGALAASPRTTTVVGPVGEADIVAAGTAADATQSR